MRQIRVTKVCIVIFKLINKIKFGKLVKTVPTSSNGDSNTHKGEHEIDADEEHLNGFNSIFNTIIKASGSDDIDEFLLKCANKSTELIKYIPHIGESLASIIRAKTEVYQHFAATFSHSSVLFSTPEREQNGQSHCSEMWDRTENGTDKFMLRLFLKAFMIFNGKCDFSVAFLSTFTLAEL